MPNTDCMSEQVHLNAGLHQHMESPLHFVAAAFHNQLVLWGGGIRYSLTTFGSC